MKDLKVGRSLIRVKDYECSTDDLYYQKEKLRLWLYVELTDACPARCPFCVHAVDQGKSSKFDLRKFAKTLRQIAPLIAGISLTGGEPMLDLSQLEDIVSMISNEVSPEIELDMVSNGLNIHRLPAMKGIERFTTIHLSRHAVDDDANRLLMHWPDAPSANDIKDAFNDLPDIGAAVLNCVLQKKGVHNITTAVDYLEMASAIGASNVSFIGMFHANDYCREQYISPLALKFDGDQRFRIWNRFHDREYCQCSSGDYKARSGSIRFYYRCPGTGTGPSYCRQLVYGADNVLRAGFGNAEEIIF